MNANVPKYNVDAEHVVRTAGFRYGGYGGKGFFDTCIQAGVTFDLIWATNATAWLGGRHPQAHVWQGKYLTDGSDKGGYDTLDGVAVDKDVCQRPFTAWGPPPVPSPAPPSVLRGPLMYYTNAEPYNGYGRPDWPAGQVKWREVFDGEKVCKLHVGPAEYIPGCVEGSKTNAELAAIPDFAGLKVPSVPSSKPLTISLTGTAT